MNNGKTSNFFQMTLLGGEGVYRADSTPIRVEGGTPQAAAASRP